MVIVAVGWDRLGRLRFTPAVFWRTATALIPLIPTWRQFVPEGRTLIPVSLPSNGDGLAALGWSGRALREFAVPEGYFLGPDRNGEGHFGPIERSYTSGIVSNTVRSGIAPTVTTAVLGDIERWRGSVVVLTATAAHAP